MDYDVVIAGGSLAGLSAAIYAAGRGANVLLLDPKSDLGAFKCAEGAMEESLVRAGFPPSTEWVTLGLYRFRMVSPAGRVLDARNLYKKLCMLDRTKLQRSMLGMAQDRGCEVRTGVRAGRFDLESGTLQLAGWERVGARTFIDATGTAAALGRQCGLPGLSRDCLALVAQWTMHATGLEEDRYQLYFGSTHHSPGGYSWIFPKGGGLFNIGGGGLASRMPKGILPRELVERFIRDRVPGQGRRIRFFASFLPCCPPLERPVMRSADGGHSLLLAGDAARLCVASVQAGIANALQSGRWAGENWDAPEKYETVLKKGMYGRLAASYKFKMGILSDGSLEALFGRTIRSMGILHKLFPAWVEQRAVDLLGF